MTHAEVEEYVLSMPSTRREYPFGEEVAVYKVGDKMFALIDEEKEPVRLSLKCDPQLSEILRERYVEVMPGYHLNKKHWITIVIAGEMPWEDIQGLIRHSYQLVVPKNEALPKNSDI
jgi:predicted DNA-binding protein (MmcQ/YjbR family)